MNDSKKNAYMTVEASLIFPVIYGAILFTISLALYLYDAAVLNQISSIAALRGSNQKMTEAEMEQYLETQINQLTNERLIMVSKVQKKIRIKESNVWISVKAKPNLPFLQIPFLNLEWQDLEFESQAKRTNPVKVIRDVRRLYGSKLPQ